MDQIKIFPYNFVEEIGLDRLQEFKNHRRLKVFYHKGTKCVSCDRVGTRLVLGKDSSSHKHWDVYTDDLFPLTVDHIIPISKGGHPSSLKNLQPMCSQCNTAKGNKGGIKMLSKHRKHGLMIKVWEIDEAKHNTFIGKIAYKRGRRANSPIVNLNSPIIQFHHDSRHVFCNNSENKMHPISIKKIFVNFKHLTEDEKKALFQGTLYELTMFEDGFLVPTYTKDVKEIHS